MDIYGKDNKKKVLSYNVKINVKRLLLLNYLIYNRLILISVIKTIFSNHIKIKKLLNQRIMSRVQIIKFSLSNNKQEGLEILFLSSLSSIRIFRYFFNMVLMSWKVLDGSNNDSLFLRSNTDESTIHKNHLNTKNKIWVSIIHSIID